MLGSSFLVPCLVEYFFVLRCHIYCGNVYWISDNSIQNPKCTNNGYINTKFKWSKYQLYFAYNKFIVSYKYCLAFWNGLNKYNCSTWGKRKHRIWTFSIDLFHLKLTEGIFSAWKIGKISTKHMSNSNYSKIHARPMESDWDVYNGWNKSNTRYRVTHNSLTQWESIR